MDKRLLQYYNRELQFMREMSGEFARDYPKVAGRLSLDEFACADPYVERLLEGFAFMAARVQLKLDAEFPRFTESILETVYPHYLAPTPSMAVVRFEPDPAQAANLVQGVTLPRGSTVNSVAAPGERTTCTYSTAHDLSLWPLEISEVGYHTRDLLEWGVPPDLDARAGIRLRLRTFGDIPFQSLGLDRLPVFLRGSDDIPMRIYEQVLGHGIGLLIQPAQRPVPWQERCRADCIRGLGFDEHEALLPYGATSFQGYRLLHEYFAFPQRFLFAELSGLGEGVARCEGNELDVMILLDQEDLELENRINVANFDLFCSPAINLFPKRADRIQLSDRHAEFHIVPDRTRAQDFEVYQVTGVTGHGLRSDEEVRFFPFYAAGRHDNGEGAGAAYYALHRASRTTSSSEKRYGRRSSYAGSEVYIALVDPDSPPYSADLRQLSVQTLCSNRDLALQMPVGRGETDFTLSTSVPVAAARCVAGPTPPRASFAEGDTTWRAISHLSLNYLSIADTGDGDSTAAFRDLLRLYGPTGEAHTVRQIDGLKAIDSRPVTRRISRAGPISFGRGLEITATFDDAPFEGAGVFLLGAVLDRFFGRYVSLNAFTETVIKTAERGEIMRWPARMGSRQIL